jgi:PAS domain-containing protein
MLATAKPALVRGLLADLLVPIFVMEKDKRARLRYVAASPAHMSAMGITVENVFRRSLAELLPAEAAAIVERCCRGAFATPAAPCRVEEWLPLAAGRSLWRASLRPLIDPATGAFRRVLGTPVGFADGEAAAASDELGAEPGGVVDAVSDLIARFGPDGSILRCSEAFARAHSLPRSALVGTSRFDRLRPAERAIVRRHLEQVRPDSPRVRTSSRSSATAGASTRNGSSTACSTRAAT